jgi:hypothetical protein
VIDRKFNAVCWVICGYTPRAAASNGLQIGLAYSAVEYLKALRWRGPRSQLILQQSKASTS